MKNAYINKMKAKIEILETIDHTFEIDLNDYIEPNLKGHARYFAMAEVINEIKNNPIEMIKQEIDFDGHIFGELGTVKITPIEEEGNIV